MRPTAMFKILTGIVGFANDYTKIARSPNAVLELNKDVPLGEHTLFLTTTADIKPNAEILLEYGAKSEFTRRTPKIIMTHLLGARKKIKTAIAFRR